MKQECTNYYCISIVQLHKVKISKSSKLIEVNKNIRRNFLYSEFSVRQIFSGTKILTAKFPYGKISLRRDFLTANFPYGEIFSGENSCGDISYHRARHLSDHELKLRNEENFLIRPSLTIPHASYLICDTIASGW